MIRNATHLSPSQFEELVAEACKKCPNCKHHIDNSDVSSQWAGLPDGIKFDPSDLELLKHLERKVGLGNSASHVLIDHFITTINETEGICYTHPENLPGIKMDGSSSHFFHRISNAYTKGYRKRRKISNRDHTVCDEHIRWHITGRSTAILDNGVIKGWRKILVLYKGSKKQGGKIDRVNWTMHQFFLGREEKDGDLVVSKVFWQLPSKRTGNLKTYADSIESNSISVEIDPVTPKTYPPQRRHPCKTEQNQLQYPVCNRISDVRHEKSSPATPIFSDLDETFEALPDLSPLPDID